MVSVCLTHIYTCHFVNKQESTMSHVLEFIKFQEIKDLICFVHYDLYMV